MERANNGDIKVVPSASFFIKYLPTIATGTLFSITYLRFALNYQEEEKRGFFYYLSWTPTILMSVLFAGTTVSNLLFGRRPNNENHYNPTSDKVVQAVGRALPAALAGLTEAGRMAATAIAGERAAGTNHMAVIASIAADHVARAVTVSNILYNHGMDRSPDFNGLMSPIERIAYYAEDSISYGVEFIVEGVYIAMESGIVKALPLNDDNRLTVIAGLYAVADVTTTTLVAVVNEYAYYGGEIASRIGMNLTPVLAFTPHPTIAQETAAVVTAVENVGANIAHAAINLGQGIEHAAEGAAHAMGHLGSEMAHAAGEVRKSIVGAERVIENLILFSSPASSAVSNNNASARTIPASGADSPSSTELNHTEIGCFGISSHHSSSGSSASGRPPRSETLYVITHLGRHSQYYKNKHNKNAAGAFDDDTKNHAEIDNKNHNAPTDNDHKNAASASSSAATGHVDTVIAGAVAEHHDE